MGGMIMLFVIGIIIVISIGIQALAPQMQAWFGISFGNSLWNREETYLVVFTLVSVGLIGAIDDYLNIREIGRTK